MIEIHELRVDYDDVCAVRDLTLEIGPGEIFGLIGPNGAGKTTTIRAACGLLEPTYGTVRVADLDVHEQAEAAQRLLGYMPDSPPLYDDLQVWEFLDLFAASYFIPRAERRETVEKYLALVQLTEKRNSRIPGLSRGMKQRLVLAKTLIHEPLVLLLDEPASGLDPISRTELKQVLQRLAEARRTVLISSHILTELSDFCTSVGIMERGRLVLSGRLDAVSEQVLGRGPLELELLAGEEALRRVLAADARVDLARLKREGRRHEFPFAGDEAAAAELLTALVGAGVRLSSFRRRKVDLEGVFLKVGAREVS